VRSFIYRGIDMKLLRRSLLVLALSGARLAVAQGGPVIAAASDLKFALDQIAAAFEKETGQPVRVSYGSSGNFVRQIAQGAPFELFLSADEEFVFRLADQGLTLDRGALYATGRLVLFVPKGSPVTADAGLADLRRALADGRLVKLAIANPEHAPYGRAAVEALQSAGLWPAIESKLVLGESVSQAAQFALSGSVQAGIFALSLALAPGVGDAGSYVPIDASLYRPLRQRMVLTRNAGATARAFYRFAQGPAARAVFKRYGFLLPGESTP
jgi:molybdate transport system substrate-binding protein